MDDLRVAVVGAGPAGLYTADALLFQQELPVRVDVLDRLPAPFGLLRYGVAPDHLRMKSLQVQLQQVLDDPRLRLFGNVDVGTDVTVAELRERYDVVVHAYGAAADRRLDVPGEDLPGSTSATRFVAWYSGHPDVTPPSDLSCRSAVVVGMGNVALDVVRVLGQPAERLAGTDVPDDVLALLRASALTDLHLLGRRGPLDARWTWKELRELGEVEGLDVLVRPDDLVLSPDEQARLDDEPALRRPFQLLHDWAARPRSGAPRRLHLRFRTRPLAVLGDDRVRGLRVEGDGGRTEELATGLVLRAVGYRGLPVAGVPFDPDRGVVPTSEGRVLRDGAVSSGEYASGWVRRGPVGVLGTNRADGQLVADAVLADAAALPRRAASDDLEQLLESRGVAFVCCSGWAAIDAAERALGARTDRPRAKIVPRPALLAAARECARA